MFRLEVDVAADCWAITLPVNPEGLINAQAEATEVNVAANSIFIVTNVPKCCSGSCDVCDRDRFKPKGYVTEMRSWRLGERESLPLFRL